MTANEDRGVAAEAAPARAVAPYTFQQLLERQVEKLGLDLAFHIHVPKASGGTVNVLFRQNNFFVLNFDMSTTDFFQDSLRGSVSRRTIARHHLDQSYLLSGHFRLDHPIFRRVCVPHVIVTTLRDPIDRMLSNYNFTLRMTRQPLAR